MAVPAVTTPATGSIRVGFAGIHARSAMGGFDGKFSIEPEIIVAVPAALTQEIIRKQGLGLPAFRL